LGGKSIGLGQHSQRAPNPSARHSTRKSRAVYLISLSTAIEKRVRSSTWTALGENNALGERKFPSRETPPPAF
jgi:hypothetical protein